MKRVTTLVTALAALALSAAGAQAVDKGSARMSWASCDPIAQNLNFTGPGQLADLVMSVTNASENHRGFRFRILIGPNVPDSWRFDAGGCAAGNTVLSTAGLNKACPAFQGTNPLPISNYGFDIDPRPSGTTATADILNAYDSTVTPPLPGTRYTLFKYTFNHAFSDFGPQNPAVACGFGEQALCLFLIYTEWLNPDLSSDTFGVEPGADFLTWNGQTGPTCPSVQTSEATWGRVKGLYR